MNNLANEFIRYFWALLFVADETFIDENFVSNEVERLYYELAEVYTEPEQQAVMAAAAEWLRQFTAEPDEHGYTPRKLLKPEHRAFLESIAWGRFLDDRA